MFAFISATQLQPKRKVPMVLYFNQPILFLWNSRKWRQAWADPFLETLLDDVARCPLCRRRAGSSKGSRTRLLLLSRGHGVSWPPFHLRRSEFLHNTLSECDRNGIEFNVTGSNIHFQLIELAVSGGGWTGSIDAHARPGPVCQAGLPTIAAKVAPGEFSDVSMLVVGGSRGLGELIAKIGAPAARM